MPSFRTLVAIAAVAAILAGTLLWLTLPESSEDPPVRTSGEALVGGPFTLTRHDGVRVTEADFAGKPMLVYFGFTYCPDVCPTELQKMTAALDMLGGEGADVQPVLISIDPERDTPEAMAAYLAHFHEDFVGLTGSPEEIAAAAGEYHVYYRKAADPGSAADYTMDHSSIIYFMGPDGRYLAHFGPGTAPDQIAETMRRHL